MKAGWKKHDTNTGKQKEEMLSTNSHKPHNTLHNELTIHSNRCARPPATIQLVLRYTRTYEDGLDEDAIPRYAPVSPVVDKGQARALEQLASPSTTPHLSGNIVTSA